eukprot:TRINITY_DN7780_c0_g1_i1.p1 TRINITY_DN7780_c0_g1~~TRINITY_DN7780_c0_g1_i1.p1  ORF type:complete len:471 (-),score=55.63 TRINITY_DN7780_c0_g1_i1:81-1493(-)
MPQRNPISAYIDNNGVNGRYQVLDVPVYGPDFDPEWTVQIMASTDYGKFSDSVYPYYWWEPSDQDTIMDVANTYLFFGWIHEPGFRFASNTDPAMFEIYSSAASGVGWNHVISKNPNSTTPKIVAFEFENTIYLISCFLDHYTVATAKEVSSGSVKIAKDNILLPPAAGLQNVDSWSLISPKLILASQTQPKGSYAAFAFEETNQNIHAVARGNFNNDNSSLSSTSAVSANSSIYIVRASSSPGSCLISLQTYEIGKALALQEKCVITSQSNYGNIQSVSIAVQLESDNKMISGVVAFATAATKLLYSFGFNVSVSAGTGSGFITSSPMLYDVGSDVSITARNGMFAEVHANGYCYNSESHNKRADISVCKSLPKSEDGVLVYSYSTLDSWLQFLENPKNGYVNSCNHHIMHGAYDEGFFPDVALLEAGSSFGIVEVHEGVGADFVDQAKCGRASSVDGVVLDSWHLAQF